MPYVLASEESQVLDLIQEADARVICGATDWLAGSTGISREARLVDISRVAEFRGLSDHGDGLRVGSATTWSDIGAASLPVALSGLRDAASEIGSRQIQNRATVGGNICNGSPAADGVVMLLALDAYVELKSVYGARRLPLCRFLLGKNTVDLHAGEMLSSVWIPYPREHSASAFCKFGIRQQLNIAVVSAAVSVNRIDSCNGLSCRIAAGSVAETPVRLRSLESLLSEVNRSVDLERIVEECDLAEIRPIDDIRSSATHRRAVLDVLICRALGLATGRLGDA